MLRIGNVQLETPLLLAPLAGYTDLAFRLAVREIRGPGEGAGTSGSGGVGLAFTELLCSTAIVRDGAKTMHLASTCPEDQPLGMQLYGADGDVLADAARWAQDHGATLIDINMGCPVDKVTKKNGGSMLLCDPAGTVALAAKVVAAVRIPVTAKIRLGWDDGRIVGPDLAPALADVGIAAVTVHGRTTEQMFRGSVRLTAIAHVVQSVRRRHANVPVIGNGDVCSPADAKAMIDATGCDGVMIGRGALGQPWIFYDTAHFLATGMLPSPLSRADKTRVVLRHFEHMLRLRGEKSALQMLRPRISWYSAQLQPWPGLRRQMQEMTSAQQVRDFLRVGMERMDRDGSTVSAAA